MRPQIEKSLAKKGIPITPYVNVWGSTPEKGWSQFFDSPRYSTGYTTLFNTLGLMVETHMLKPYKIRVKQTYELILSTLDFSEINSSKIKDLRKKIAKELGLPPAILFMEPSLIDMANQYPIILSNL